MKTTFLGKKGPELSAVEPVFYQERFAKVINNRIITIAESEKKKKEPKVYHEGSNMNFEKGPDEEEGNRVVSCDALIKTSLN